LYTTMNHKKWKKYLTEKKVALPMARDELISDTAPAWCKPGLEVEFKNPEMHPAAMRDDIHTFIITGPKERDNIGIVRSDEWCENQMCEDATERIVSYLELKPFEEKEETIIGELNEEVDRLFYDALIK